MEVWFGDLNFDTIMLISRDPLQIFQNQFLRWNRELKPVILSTMNPINGTNFFLSYKGGGSFLKSRTPQLKPLKIENFNDFPKTYIIYPNNYYQPNWKCDFLNFQPTLVRTPVLASLSLLSLLLTRSCCSPTTASSMSSRMTRHARVFCLMTQSLMPISG